MTSYCIFFNTNSLRLQMLLSLFYFIFHIKRRLAMAIDVKKLLISLKPSAFNGF